MSQSFNSGLTTASINGTIKSVSQFAQLGSTQEALLINASMTSNGQILYTVPAGKIAYFTHIANLHTSIASIRETTGTTNIISLPVSSVTPVFLKLIAGENLRSAGIGGSITAMGYLTDA